MTTAAMQPYSPPAESRPGTSQIAPAATKPAGDIKPAETVSPYAGLAVAPFSPEAVRVLNEPIPLEDFDILPTGEVYASQVRYRRKLNEAFGQGAWGLMPRGPITLKDNTMMREYALVVNSRFVSEAVGECDYQPNNNRMSYASVAEGVKSNALVRCCKDIGIASECWDRHWAENFKRQHCILVRRQGSQRPEWRRIDAEPFYNETGPVEPRNPQPQQQRQQATQQRPATGSRAAQPQQPAAPEAGGFDEPGDAQELEPTNDQTGVAIFSLYDDLPSDLRKAVLEAFRTRELADLSANVHQAGEERAEAVLAAMTHAHRTKLTGARLLGWIANYHAGRKEPKPATFAEVPPHAFNAAGRALEKEVDGRFAPKSEPAPAGGA